MPSTARLISASLAVAGVFVLLDVLLLANGKTRGVGEPSSLETVILAGVLSQATLLGLWSSHPGWDQPWRFFLAFLGIAGLSAAVSTKSSYEGHFNAQQFTQLMLGLGGVMSLTLVPLTIAQWRCRGLQPVEPALAPAEGRRFQFGIGHLLSWLTIAALILAGFQCFGDRAVTQEFARNWGSFFLFAGVFAGMGLPAIYLVLGRRAMAWRIIPAAVAYGIAIAVIWYTLGPALLFPGAHLVIMVLALLPIRWAGYRWGRPRVIAARDNSSAPST